jgi:fructokinase
LNEAQAGIESDNILHGWVGESIVDAITEVYDVPTTLENDTALAGLGEAHFGAGKDIDLFVYHTISTGVGGVKIEHGTVAPASYGFEPGKQIIDIDRTIMGEEIEPTLENLISGSGVSKRFGTPAPEIPQTDLMWDELAQLLAQGLRNTTLYWSPEAIILGGAMILGDPKIPLENIRKHTVAALGDIMPCPFITTAQLGDMGALYGALSRCRE